jgi:hypothetical protein
MKLQQAKLSSKVSRGLEGGGSVRFPPYKITTAQCTFVPFPSGAAVHTARRRRLCVSLFQGFFPSHVSTSSPWVASSADCWSLQVTNGDTTKSPPAMSFSGACRSVGLYDPAAYCSNGTAPSKPPRVLRVWRLQAPSKGAHGQRISTTCVLSFKLLSERNSVGCNTSVRI